MPITMPAPEFVRGVNSVIGSADEDRTMSALNAVRVEWDADGFVFVATNRYTLSEQTIPLADPEREAGKVSIPLEAVKAALAVLKAIAPKGNLLDDRKVELVSTPEFGRASVMGVDFETPGEFPKWRSLFPADDACTEIGRLLFEPSLLAQLAGPKVKGRWPQLALRFTGETKPVVVLRQDVEGFRAILMPCRPAA